MHLLLFPIELQLLTLCNLPFRDVLKCRALSKHFCTLIDTNKDLVFTIELGAASVLDATDPLVPREMKFDTLWELNVAWANLHWHCRRQIPLPGTTKLFDVSGGLFFRAFESNDAVETTHSIVEWFKLPCRREPNLLSTPKALTFDVALIDFAADAHRDLIIGVELTSFKCGRFYTMSCNIYAKTLSTNQVHPASSRNVLSHRFVSPTKEFEPLLEICGNHVGILLSRGAQATSRDAFDMFLVVDWTTSVFKATMSSYASQESWQTFAFVTPDSVVIPSTSNSLLNMFHFDEGANSLRHDISLLLPEPVERDTLRRASMRVQPFASRPTPGVHAFIPDPDEAIIILWLEYIFRTDGNLGPPRYSLPQVVAIPRRVLAYYASIARKGGRELMNIIGEPHEGVNAGVVLEVKVPGGGLDAQFVNKRTRMNSLDKRSPSLLTDKWIHETRWGLDSVPPSMGMFSFGSRYLSMSSRAVLPNAPDSAIALYDFNLRNERRGYLEDLYEDNLRPNPQPEGPRNEDDEWDFDERTGARRWPVSPSRIVKKPTTVSIPEVFKNPFTTCLPYRVTETEEVLPWDSAILDGERIIGLDFEDFNYGFMRQIDVIVM